MRALMVAEQLRRPVPGGIGTYVRGVIAGLAALGPDAPDLALWASRAPGRGGRPDPLAALAPVVTSPLPGPALVAAWDRGWLGPPAGADVVHAPSLAVPGAGPAPMAVTVHDLAWRRVPGAFPTRGRRWHEAALGRALARAELFVVPSRLTADDLVGAGAPAGRVEIVEEGADHLPPPDPAAGDALLARLGVAGAYLLTVSTLEPRKNLARLVAAYRSARSRLPEPWPLVVVGPQGWGPTLAPEPGVVMAGAVEGPALAALYAGARVVASVPLVEGFGLPAVEAMAAGTPVVASPMPSTGEAALTVEPTDVAAMADALWRAATDDALRLELTEAGRTRTAGLTWAAAAARHAELWEALASRRSPPGRAMMVARDRSRGVGDRR